MQCLGFCTADVWPSLAYESAEQKPKHCLTPGFLIPLLVTRDHSLLDSTFDTNLTLLSPRVAAPTLRCSCFFFICLLVLIWRNFFPSHEITKKNELTCEVSRCAIPIPHWKKILSVGNKNKIYDINLWVGYLSMQVESFLRHCEFGI